jgi:cell wall assembly regulator SMI1
MATAREELEILCRKGEVSGPVNVTAIEQAEAELGVQFPLEYREFLKKFGAVIADGIEVYGLPNSDTNDPPMWQDVVAVTNELRNWGQAGTERKGFVPICDDGTGVYFFLDTTKSPKTEIWAIGPGVEKMVLSSFSEFLVDLSNGKITI